MVKIRFSAEERPPERPVATPEAPGAPQTPTPIVLLDDEDLPALESSADARGPRESSPALNGIEIIDITDDADPASLHDTNLADYRCPICMEAPEVFCVPSCGHMYCQDCIFEALRSTGHTTKVAGNCSVCRKNVRYDSVWFMEFRLPRTAEQVKADEAAAEAERAAKAADKAGKARARRKRTAAAGAGTPEKKRARPRAATEPPEAEIKAEKTPVGAASPAETAAPA